MSKTIAVVTTSLSEDSRSRIAAKQIEESLKSLGLETEWIDLSQISMLPYPKSEDDKDLNEIIEKVYKADALVLAFPIYNYGESGHTRDFLAYTLDKKEMENKVCLLIAGCSTHASFLAPMSLSKTLQAEIGAVMLGPGILACGDDIDKEKRSVSDKLQERLTGGAELINKFI